MINKSLNIFLILTFAALTGCKNTGGVLEGSIDGVLGRATLITGSLNVNINEGSSLAMMITMDKAVTSDATLNWSIAGGSGVFTATSGTVSVPSGQQFALVQLDSVGNSTGDGNQTYILTIAGSILTFSNSLAINVTVIDDEAGMNTQTWTFATPSQYTYDTNYVDLSSGTKAALKTVNTILDSLSTFNAGSHAGTKFSGGVLTFQTSTDTTDLSVRTLLPSKNANMIGYWRFDGNYNDETGNYNATAHASSTRTSTAFIGSQALVTSNGYDEPLEVTGSAFQNLSQMSFCFWVRPTANTDWVRFLALSDKTTWSPSRSVLTFFTYDSSLSHAPQLEILFADASTTYSRFPVLLLNSWTQLCTTYDGAHLYTYSNGVMIGSEAKTGNIASPTTNEVLAIMGVPAPNFYQGLVGQMDELVFWNTGLTPAEVSALYKAQSQKFNELSSTWTPKYSSLLAYWRFDGDWIDSVGLVELTPEGTGATVTATGAKVGTGTASFDGVHRAIKTSVTMNLTSGYAVGGWAKPTTVGVTQEMTRKGVSPSIPWQITLTSSNTFRCSIYNSGASSVIVTESSALKSYLNVWTHVMCVYDPVAATLSLYVDGQLRTSSAISGNTPQTTSSTIYVGGAGQWAGLIDDIALWGATLTSGDVATIYHHQKQKYAGTYTSPIFNMGDASATWTSLAPETNLPYGKELPTSSTETTYSSLFTGTTLQTNLSKYFNFGNSTGTIADNTTVAAAFGTDGSGKNANATGFTYSTNGLLSSGLYFSGTDDYLDVGAYGTELTSYTVSLWFKSGNYTSGSRALLQHGDVAACFYNPQIMVNNSARTMNVSESGCASAGALVTGATILEGWNHVAVTRDNQTVVVYLNGQVLVTDTSQPAPNTSPTNGRALVGGRHSHGNTPTYIDMWTGTVDEYAVWTRPLSSDEVVQLYRRAANRMKYQVRSCAEPTCSCKSLATNGTTSDCSNDGTTNDSVSSDSRQATWIGPDGTSATFFSELHNNSAVNSSGLPTGSVNNSALTLDWSGSFFTSTARPAANQYFQVRTYLEAEDNTACSSAACLPSVTKMTVGPANRYYAGQPTVQNVTGITVTQLSTLSRTQNNSCTTYQISMDGTNWKYWNGSAWTAATTSAHTNVMDDLTTGRLQSLGAGVFFFKAFLSTNAAFTQSCDLSHVELLYFP